MFDEHISEICLCSVCLEKIQRNVVFTFTGSLNVSDEIYALIEPRLADVCEVSWRKSFCLFIRKLMTRLQ